MTREKQFEEMPTIAVCTYMGMQIEIKDIEHGINDRILFTLTWGNKRSYHKKRIYYGNKPYFMAEGIRVPVEKCERIGWIL